MLVILLGGTYDPLGRGKTFFPLTILGKIISPKTRTKVLGKLGKGVPCKGLRLVFRKGFGFGPVLGESTKHLSWNFSRNERPIQKALARVMKQKL